MTSQTVAGHKDHLAVPAFSFSRGLVLSVCSVQHSLTAGHQWPCACPGGLIWTV